MFKIKQKRFDWKFEKKSKALGFFNFLSRIFLCDIYVLTIGSDWGILKTVRIALLNLSILNGPREAAVHSREVGEKDITMLFCARAGSELVIIFESHRSAQNQYLNEWRWLRETLVTKFEEKWEIVTEIVFSHKNRQRWLTGSLGAKTSLKGITEVLQGFKTMNAKKTHIQRGPYPLNTA